MKLSIVIPVYNSQNIIAKTIKQILIETNKNNLDIEIILINDGSSDDSWRVIRGLAKEHQEIKSINLIKNFGQHNAILCGFENAIGDYVITMDDDLQNPPSEIIHLVNKITKNKQCDLVFGKFKEKKHVGYRKLGSKFVGYLNYKIFNKPKNITLTNFRIIKKDVIDRLLQHNTSHPYIPGLLLLYATNILNVSIEHHNRIYGKSNYTFKKLFSLVGNILINYSSYPLKVLSSIGFVISSISFITGLFFLISELVNGTSVTGWTTIVVLTSFLGGFIIVLLGLIGEYLSRILDQMSNNKSYCIKEIVDE